MGSASPRAVTCELKAIAAVSPSLAETLRKSHAPYGVFVNTETVFEPELATARSGTLNNSATGTIEVVAGTNTLG